MTHKKFKEHIKRIAELNKKTRKSLKEAWISLLKLLEMELNDRNK